MKKIRKNILLAITLVIAGLMIAVSTSTAIQTQTPDEQSFFVTRNTNVNIAGMDISPLTGVKNPLIKPQGKTAIPVFPGYHHAVASDALGYVVLGFEDDTPNVWFTASNDAGQNWATDAVGWQIDPAPTLPDVDSCGDGRFIGGMVPDYMASDGSELYKVISTDPMDFTSGYDCPYWQWNTVGSGYFDFTAIACAGYTKGDPIEDSWGFGGHSMIGTWNYVTPSAGTPLYSYQSNEAGSAWIYRMDTTKIGGTSTSMDIDPTTLHSFAVWNYDNGGNMDLYVYEADWSIWEPYSSSQIHPDVAETTITSTGDDNLVDISANNDNIIIVSERDGDIVAYYSTDGLVTVLEAQIETGAVNPRVVHTGDLEATCTFIEGGSVYYSTTENGGETWSTPEIIDEPENANVPSEFKASDVCGFGAAWMNSDDGNIYFASLGANSPPLIPAIDGPTQLKRFLNYDFTFSTTDPNGDDVSYYVDWGDGTNSGWTTMSASGAGITLSHKWTTKAVFTIKCKAKDTSDAESDWGILEVSTPRVVTRPMLLQRLLEKFPNAFPILRQLLGF